MGRFGVAQDVGEALPRAREGGCSRAAPAGGARLSRVWPEESAGAPHCGRSVARVPEAAPAMKEGGSSLLRAPPRRHRAAGPLSQLPRVGFHVADFEPAPTAGLSRRKAEGCGGDQELEGGFPHPRAVGGLEWVPRKVLLSYPLPRLPFSWLMAEAQRFPSASQLRTVWEPPHTHPEGNPPPHAQ